MQYCTTNSTIQHYTLNITAHGTLYITALHTSKYSTTHYTIQHYTIYNTALHTVHYSTWHTVHYTLSNTALHTVQYINIMISLEEAFGAISSHHKHSGEFRAFRSLQEH